MVPEAKLARYHISLLSCGRHSFRPVVAVVGLIMCAFPINDAEADDQCRASGRCTIVADTAHPTSSLDVARGEIFSVCLPLVSGAGQIWKLQDNDDGRAFEAAEPPAFETKENMPGGEAHMRFALRSSTAGHYKLVFQKFGPGRLAKELDSYSVSLMVR